MSFEIDLYTFLNDNITTTGNVSSNITNTNENDYLIYTKITTSTTYSHDGSDKIETARYQFDGYAQKKIDALNIIEEVQELLDNFHGWMGDTRVQGVFVLDEFDDYEDETGLYRNETELKFQYYK